MNIHADVFPCFVSVTPAGTDIAMEDLRSSPPSRDSYQIAITRVVISANVLYVAQDHHTGPVIVFQEEIDPTTYYKSDDIRSKDSYIQTISGKKIAWKKDSACGCGSRLKSWSPTRYAMSSKDPVA